MTTPPTPHARDILKKHATRYGDSQYEPASWVIDAMLEAALAAQPPAVAAIPEGWKLVPIEPTLEMLAATDIEDTEYYFHSMEGARAFLAAHYRAMVAAVLNSPVAQPPAGQQDRGEVRKAFDEGYELGHSDGLSDAHLGRHGYGLESCWNDSDTKASLSAPATAGEATAAQGADWLPIETAPRDGTLFMAFEPGAESQRYECWWQNDFSNWSGWQTTWDNEPNPTHWKPLDAAPSPAAPGNREKS